MVVLRTKSPGCGPSAAFGSRSGTSITACPNDSLFERRLFKRTSRISNHSLLAQSSHRKFKRSEAKAHEDQTLNMAEHLYIAETPDSVKNAKVDGIRLISICCNAHTC